MPRASSPALALFLLAAAAPAQTINFARTDVPTALKVHDTAAGDLDGDGVLDLAAVGKEIKRVSVLLGTGGGSFAPFQLVSGIGAGPVSVVAGDLTGDGIDDLAVACRDDDVVWTLNGVSGGPPVLGASHAVGDAPKWIVAADFDLDGDLDLATPNDGSSDAAVLLGDGLGGFGAASFHALGDAITTETMMVATDCHADGDPDLVTASNASKLWILHGDGTGAFVPTFSLASPGQQTLWCAAGDLDGDLLPDLISREFSGLDNEIAFFRGNAAGGFTYQGWNEPMLVACQLVDANGDGALDMLAVLNGGPPPHETRLGMRPGTGTSVTFGAEQRFQLAKSFPFSLRAADFDGNGQVDAVVPYGSSFNSPTFVSVFRQTPPAPPTLTSVAPAAISVLRPQGTLLALSAEGSGFTTLATAMLGTLSLVSGPGSDSAVTYGDGAFSIVSGLNPLPLPLGPTTLSVTNSFGSASFPVTIVAPDPPVLHCQTTFSSAVAVKLGAGAGSLTYLAASLDALPSSIPGLVDLGIGSGFATLVNLGTSVVPAAGHFTKGFPTPGIPGGTTIHFQFASLDLAAPAFPLKVSNVASGTKN